MSTDATLSDLLADEAWARGLARALVGESRGDDLLQASYLRAIQSPPRRAGPLRAWFATVMRNTAKNQARSEGRRRAREEDSARPEADGETPYEIRARIEQRQVLAEQLLELPENLRTALVLRFEEGLKGPEIARRLGVPEGTVRWRLERGLERLREQLDTKHNGEREVWMRALTPLAGLGLPEGARAGGLAVAAAVLATAGAAASVPLGLWEAAAPDGRSAAVLNLPAGDDDEDLYAAGRALGAVEPGWLRVELASERGFEQEVEVTVEGLFGSKVRWTETLSMPLGSARDLELPTRRVTNYRVSTAGTEDLLGASVRARKDHGELPDRVRLNHDLALDLSGLLVDFQGVPIGPCEAEVRLWPDRGWERVAVDGSGRFTAVGRTDREAFDPPAARGVSITYRDELELDGYVLLASSDWRVRAADSRARARVGSLRDTLALLSGNALAVTGASSTPLAVPANRPDRLLVATPSAQIELSLDRGLPEGAKVRIQPSDREKLERAPLEFAAYFTVVSRSYLTSNLYPSGPQDARPDRFTAEVPAGIPLALSFDSGTSRAQQSVYPSVDVHGRLSARTGDALQELVLRPGECRTLRLESPFLATVTGKVEFVRNGKRVAEAKSFVPVRLQYRTGPVGLERWVVVQTRVDQEDGSFEASLPDVMLGTSVNAWVDGTDPDGAPVTGMASAVFRGRPLELAVSFSAPLALTGTLSSESRLPHRLMRLAAIPINGDLSRSSTGDVGADGRFRLPVLERGAYRLVAVLHSSSDYGSADLGTFHAPASKLKVELPDTSRCSELDLTVISGGSALVDLDVHWRASPWVGPSGEALEPWGPDREQALAAEPTWIPSTDALFTWGPLLPTHDPFLDPQPRTTVTVSGLKPGLGPIDVRLDPRFEDGRVGAPVLLTGIGGPGQQPIVVTLEPLRSVELVLGPEFATSVRIGVLVPETGESALHEPSGLRRSERLEVDGALSMLAWLPADLSGFEVVGLDASGAELVRFLLELRAGGSSTSQREFTP